MAVVSGRRVGDGPLASGVGGKRSYKTTAHYMSRLGNFSSSQTSSIDDTSSKSSSVSHPRKNRCRPRARDKRSVWWYPKIDKIKIEAQIFAVHSKICQ